MRVKERKTVGRTTIVIHRITKAEVYYAKSCACGCGTWALRIMDRDDFERQWNEAKENS